MNIKITSTTSIKPLLDSNLLAYITREAFCISIRIREGEFQLALMQLMYDFEGFSCTGHMEIIFTVSAVVAEAISTVVAGITIEKAMGVFRPWKQNQRVPWMTRVIYQFWELSAAQMEGEVARLTCVHLG